MQSAVVCGFVVMARWVFRSGISSGVAYSLFEFPFVSVGKLLSRSISAETLLVDY